MESRFDRTLLDALATTGHDIALLDEPYSDMMGHAGAVVLHPNGICEGAHDRRADGGAAGVQNSINDFTHIAYATDDRRLLTMMSWATAPVWFRLIQRPAPHRAFSQIQFF
jgi:hypothetical protein